MTSPVQICNLALSWMGQDRINSLTDNQNEAIVMNDNFELSRDKVLEDHAWTFATERQIVSAQASGPAFGGGNRFLIPKDVLRVHRVYRPSNNLQTNQFTNARWVREGQYIISDEEVIWAVFIMKVTDPTLFSPNFVHALAARLAADTAITLTESRKLAEDMEAKYEMKLADATFSDGSQGRTEVQQSTKLTGARTR